MTHVLRHVREEGDIPPSLRGTPLAELLACHNLGAPLRHRARAELVVATCMDHRVRLRIPRGFAYVVRTPGANLEGQECGVAFGVAVGGARAIAVIGHDDCGMAAVGRLRDRVVEGLVARAGWPARDAEELHRLSAPRSAIDDPAAFAFREAARMRRLFPRVPAAAFLYRLPGGELELVAAA